MKRNGSIMEEEERRDRKGRGRRRMTRTRNRKRRRRRRRNTRTRTEKGRKRKRRDEEEATRRFFFWLDAYTQSILPYILSRCCHRFSVDTEAMTQILSRYCHG